MINTKKYYFLPFLDNITAIGIAFLMFMILGSWMSNAVFAAIATFFMLFTLCGRIYVRMWKLSERNTKRKYSLTVKDFAKFLLPLVIFDLVIILVYYFCEWGILPLDEIITKSYYNFPDDAARELITISALDYFTVIIRFWFLYLVCLPFNGLTLLLAPVLSFASGMMGYKFGAKDKMILHSYIKITEKAKKKFNE